MTHSAQDHKADTPLKAALAYLKAGMGVLPIHADGRNQDHAKTPDLPKGHQYLKQRPTEADLRDWFADGSRGIGIPGGAVSGNLECIDFDLEAERTFPAWGELVEAECPGLLRRLSVARTPTGGYHVRYRCEEPVPGSSKLARLAAPRVEGRKRKDTLIETRGEGGYALAPGTPAHCHPAGTPYLHFSGPKLSEVPTITAAERSCLIESARAFDQAPKKVRHSANGHAGGGISPGDDYDRRGPDWSEILRPHGWECVSGSPGGERRWRRPGKEGGWSATTGVCKGNSGEDLLNVFSGNASPFDIGQYGRFNAFAILNHGGDRSAAAKALRAQGYGTPLPRGGTQASASNGKAAPPRPKRVLMLPEWSPFPVASLPAVAREYVQASAEAIGCEPAMIALPLLAALAGLVGNTRRLSVKPGWTEPSVIWSLVAAPSGQLKSPAFAAALDPVCEIQGEMIDDYKAARARRDAWEDAPGGEKPDDPEAPTRFWTADATVECLADLLEENPRGMLLARDELDAWFQSFVRYKGGAGGTDRPHWLEMHGARTLQIDRKTSDKRAIHVRRAAVSVTGTIQPEILQTALDKQARQSGLAARFLMTMPPRRQRKWTDAEISQDTQGRYEALLLDLLRLELEDRKRRRAHLLKWSPAAKRRWVEWYDEWGERQFRSEGEQAAAEAKLEAYSARLALLHHVVTEVAAARPALSPVSLASLDAAIAMTRWFALEADRIYLTFSESDDARELRKLAEWVRERGGEATARDLQRASRKYADADAAGDALNELVEAGQGCWVEQGPGDQGGRPRRIFRLRVDADKTDETPGASADRTRRPPTATSKSHGDFEVLSVLSASAPGAGGAAAPPAT